MATISLDLRERIVRAYDRQQGTRLQIAQRFEVSLGLVKKLLQQRRHEGDIASRYHRAGRRPGHVAAQRRQFRALLAKKPDLTLEELRAAAGLDCSLAAIHYVLAKLGLTYKKRRSAPASKIAPTSPAPGAPGGGGRRASTRRG